MVVGATLVWVFHKLLIYWDFPHMTVQGLQRENAVIVWTSLGGSLTLLVSEESGQCASGWPLVTAEVCRGASLDVHPLKRWRGRAPAAEAARSDECLQGRRAWSHPALTSGSSRRWWCNGAEDHFLVAAEQWLNGSCRTECCFWPHECSHLMMSQSSVTHCLKQGINNWKN